MKKTALTLIAMTAAIAALSETLPPIKVWAERWAIPDSAATTDSLQSPSAMPMNELTQKMPGLFITRRVPVGYGVANGAAGHISLMTLGGSPTTDVIVAYDGVPMRMGLMGHPVLDGVGSAGVGTAVVHYGASPLEWGDQAMGGVIELNSIEQGHLANISAEYGSFGTASLKLTNSIARARLGITTSIEWIESQGERDNSYGNRTSASLHMYRWLGGGKLSMTLRGARSHTLDPGTENNPYENHYFNIDRATGSLRYERPHLNITLYSNAGEHNLYDGWHSTDFEYGIKGITTLGIISLGADAALLGGKGHNNFKNYGYHDLWNAGTFASIARHIASIGARVGIKMNIQKDHDPVLAPEIALWRRLGKGFAISAKAALGFRNPTIRELYLFPAPNESLKVEKAWTISAALRGKNISVMPFMVVGNNMIRITGHWPAMESSNSGSFTHYGVMFAAGHSFRDSLLSLWTNYTYQDVGDETAYNPEHIWKGGIKLHRRRVSFELWSEGARELYASDNKNDPMPPYLILQGKIGFQLMRKLSFYIRGENITNVKYYTQNGYPMPGFGLYGGFETNYK